MFVTTGTNTQQISAPIILEPSLTEQKVANKIFILKNVHSNDDYIVNMQNQGASAVIVVTLSNSKFRIREHFQQSYCNCYI